MPYPHLAVEISPTRPGPVTAGLAGLGTGAGESGMKAVMAADGLLHRLRAERSANRSAWARAMAAPPAS